MFNIVRRLLCKRSSKNKQLLPQFEELAKAVSDNRPILRRADLERIEQTHRELEQAVRETRDEAHKLAAILAEDLEQARRRVHIVLDSLMDALVSVDSKGIIVGVNASLERMTGFTSDELVGRHINESVLKFTATTINFYKESLEYVSYLADVNPEPLFSKDKAAYRSYVERPGSRLNTVGVHDCVTKAGKHVAAEVYANILNIDCRDPDSLLYIVVLVDVSKRTEALLAVDDLTQVKKGLLSVTPNPVFMKDSRLRFSGSNQAFCNFFGLKPEDFMGRSVYDVFPAGVAKTLADLDFSLLKAAPNSVESAQLSLTLEAGERDVVVHCSGMRNDAGAFSGMLGTVVDLTEILSAQRFQETLLNAVPNPVYVLDKDLIYVACNQAYASMVGLPKDKIIGSDRQVVLANLHLSNSEARSVSQQKDLNLHLNVETTQVYEKRFYSTRTGRFHDVVAHRTAIIDKFGHFDGVLCVMTDITHITNTRIIQQCVFDTSPSPMYYKDHSSQYVVCNQAFADWFGLDKQELVGLTFSQAYGLARLRSGNCCSIEQDSVITESIEAISKAEHSLVANSACTVNRLKVQMWHFGLNQLCEVEIQHTALRDASANLDGFAGCLVGAAPALSETD